LVWCSVLVMSTRVAKQLGRWAYSYGRERGKWARARQARQGGQRVLPMPSWQRVLIAAPSCFLNSQLSKLATPYTRNARHTSSTRDSCKTAYVARMQRRACVYGRCLQARQGRQDKATHAIRHARACSPHPSASSIPRTSHAARANALKREREREHARARERESERGERERRGRGRERERERKKRERQRERASERELGEEACLW
jgi:hypothetical protein